MSQVILGTIHHHLGGMLDTVMQKALLLSGIAEQIVHFTVKAELLRVCETTSLEVQFVDLILSCLTGDRVYHDMRVIFLGCTLRSACRLTFHH
jgi:hypothetical protein